MAKGGTLLGHRQVARQFALQRAGQQRPEHLAAVDQALEQVRMRHQRAQPLAQQTLADRTRHRRIDHRPADVQQVVVIDPRRAGGFAVAARQAAIQVLLGLLRDLVAFQHLLDQVDAPARAIQFIAEQLIGRAGGVAESAVHAGAQDAVGFFGAGQLAGAFAQGGLHDS